MIQDKELYEQIIKELVHVIRNSLTSIQGFMYLLEKRLIVSSNKEKELLYISLVIGEVEEINCFISSMLKEIKINEKTPFLNRKKGLYMKK